MIFSALPGLKYYQDRLRLLLEPDHLGEFVAIDAEASSYALGDTPVGAHDRLKAQGSTGWHVLIRVGDEAAFEMLQR